jgi:hypothetical protein
MPARVERLSGLFSKRSIPTASLPDLIQGYPVHGAMTGRPSFTFCVIAGLDPAIQLRSRQIRLLRWITGSRRLRVGPVMTPRTKKRFVSPSYIECD